MLYGAQNFPHHFHVFKNVTLNISAIVMYLYRSHFFSYHPSPFRALVRTGAWHPQIFEILYKNSL